MEGAAAIPGPGTLREGRPPRKPKVKALGGTANQRRLNRATSARKLVQSSFPKFARDQMQAKAMPRSGDGRMKALASLEEVAIERIEELNPDGFDWTLAEQKLAFMRYLLPPLELPTIFELASSRDSNLSTHSNASNSSVPEDLVLPKHITDTRASVLGAIGEELDMEVAQMICAQLKPFVLLRYGTHTVQANSIEINRSVIIPDSRKQEVEGGNCASGHIGSGNGGGGGGAGTGGGGGGSPWNRLGLGGTSLAFGGSSSSSSSSQPVSPSGAAAEKLARRTEAGNGKGKGMHGMAVSMLRSQPGDMITPAPAPSGGSFPEPRRARPLSQSMDVPGSLTHPHNNSSSFLTNTAGVDSMYENVAHSSSPHGRQNAHKQPHMSPLSADSIETRIVRAKNLMNVGARKLMDRVSSTDSQDSAGLGGSSGSRGNVGGMTLAGLRQRKSDVINSWGAGAGSRDHEKVAPQDAAGRTAAAAGAAAGGAGAGAGAGAAARGKVKLGQLKSKLSRSLDGLSPAPGGSSTDSDEGAAQAKAEAEAPPARSVKFGGEDGRGVDREKDGSGGKIRQHGVQFSDDPAGGVDAGHSLYNEKASDHQQKASMFTSLHGGGAEDPERDVRVVGVITPASLHQGDKKPARSVKFGAASMSLCGGGGGMFASVDVRGEVSDEDEDD